ncbi:nickel-type superoxide dismutase maturation protease [Streptomyces orinoci]|uniref:Nickel-type superoxide dismutase maturation protease n=1 Tax=Streptomyces orinoci TaxID=67339 RepID=A0ABV3JT12_STRON|nr:nickel-type superoxide dismutase maturation protease [Streptomyces orinoci]
MQEQLDERGQELDRERRGLLRIGLAEVYNPSMVPTLNPGDQLVVQYGAVVRPGNVVVVRHPFRQDLLIVKRAVERRDGGWWVLGDNPLVENDSREFGTVPDELVVARAWIRLRRPPAPGGRSAAALLRWVCSAVRPMRGVGYPGRSLSRRLRAR